MNLTIAELDTAAAGFDDALGRLLAHDDDTADADTVAAEIIAAVRRDGDAALLKFTAQFDDHAVADAVDLELPRARVDAALAAVAADAPKVVAALRFAARRIEKFHREQKKQNNNAWHITDADGTRVGQRVTPLARVGVYVPGGTAAYPSSVLMTVIPARVAGVGEVVMTAPAPGGEVNDTVLAAAALAGVDRVFTVGGAQAVAALAYGTDTLPAVDKIVGPGNRYVAAAKRRVFGAVGIDTVAGPSEVLIICDARANSEWVAADLCAQAEHDADARAVVVSDNAAVLHDIRRDLERLLPQLARRDIVAESFARHGALIKVADIGEAIALANRIAPEHLQLMVAKPRRWLSEVKNAGAIFVGAHSAEALADYCAGPNHVLPTAGAARFSSPLGVDDFVKRSSVVEATARGAGRLAAVAAELARCEGLDAHARSAECRLHKK